MSRGLFVSFEGGDGAGKSTQVKKLAEFLEENGHSVVMTREPGGAEGAEAIRDLLVNGPTEKWDAITEALLMYAARTDHIRQTIAPALAKGKIVISDRFSDSTMAYQGYAGALGVKRVAQLNSVILGEFKPDFTVILDVTEDVGLARARNRSTDESRFENKGDAYQAHVRDAFLKIAESNADRCLVIDASKSIDEIANEISLEVLNRLGACNL